MKREFFFESSCSSDTIKATFVSNEGTEVKSVSQRGFLVAAAVFVLAVTQLGSYAAAAAATQKVNTSSSNKATSANENSIRISPLRTDLTIAAGKTGTVEIDVTNLTKGTAEYQAIENDFVAGDEKGTPAIILDQNAYAPTHSLKRFMVPLPNITVPAGATKAVDVTIKVPITAQAGGYFGALRFAPAAAGSQPLSLSSSAASLILLTVPGPTVQKLDLTNFEVQQNGYTSTNFRTPNNLSLLIRFTNQGNLQEAPFGQINVTKGKTKLLFTDDFNQSQPPDEILPDSARRWSIPLQNVGKFGKFTVTATLTYGNGQSIQVSKDFWVVPTKYIIGAIVVLIVLILLIWIIVRTIRNSRRRNRYRGR